MPQPIVIGIAGGSGSGKSWLTQKIKERFPDKTTVVSHDWYYKDLSSLPSEKAAKTNFDHPDALETELLIEHLDRLIEGQFVQAPDYDFASHSRKSETHSLSPNALIIVEGLFALRNTALRSRYSKSIFIEVAADTRLIRRIKRDLVERKYDLNHILSSWETHAIPMFDSIVLPTAEFATIRCKSLSNKAFVTEFLSDLDRQLANNADDENQGIRQGDR